MLTYEKGKQEANSHFKNAAFSVYYRKNKQQNISLDIS